MAGLPLYKVISCCGNTSTLVFINNIPPGPGFVEGMYAVSVNTPLGSGGQPVLQRGICYIITLAGTTALPGNIDPNTGISYGEVDWNALVELEAGSSEECSDYSLYLSPTGCQCSWQYSISPCCPEHGSQGASAELANIFLVDEATFISGDVFNYIGSAIVTFPGSNLELVPGACYTITRNENLEPQDLPIQLIYSAFIHVGAAGTGCKDAACLECEAPGISYLKYTECCSGKEIFRRTDTYLGAPGGSVGSTTGPIVDIASYLGIVQFLGALGVFKTDFIAGGCYDVTLHTLGSETGANTPQTEADYNNLPLAPYSTQFNQTGTQCEEAPCPPCKAIIYQLTNCEGISILTDSDLSAEVGTFVELDGISGCWQVQLNSPIVVNPGLGSTLDPSSEINSRKALIGTRLPYTPNVLPGLQTQPVTVTGPCPGCDCKCYEVTGYTGAYSYIDCNGITRTVMSSGSERFCASARPDIKGKEGIDYVITEGDDCVDNQCVDKCFLLTNCDPTAHPNQDATITSTLQSLSQYLNTSSVVELSGYDGCWSVTEAVECDCPVDVTVIRDHKDCEECLGITAYKLSNCEKINEVLYTLQDFSAFVGKVIKDECACWVVEEIDYQPPSETTIVDPIAFEDCNACLATYYTLTDCDDPTSVIISSTNLSAYVDQVIKIEGCTPCYEVALYIEPIAPEQWQEVTVTEASKTCFDCKQLVPRCSTVFNNSTEDRFFTYINTNGDPEQTEVVKSGHFSLRTCVQYWTEPDTFIYNFYGDCTVFEDPKSSIKTGFCVQHFPNNRKVKPGYNTPICSAEKYDKITCKAADIMYKKALELRYGISNCCPEEDEKWLIKKELIELQALTDPDYPCDHLADCSCNS